MSTQYELEGPKASLLNSSLHTLGYPVIHISSGSWILNLNRWVLKLITSNSTLYVTMSCQHWATQPWTWFIRAQGTDSSSRPCALHHCSILAAGFSSLDTRNTKHEWKWKWKYQTTSSVCMSPKAFNPLHGYSALIPGIVPLIAAALKYFSCHLTVVGGLWSQQQWSSHCCHFGAHLLQMPQLQLLRI